MRRDPSPLLVPRLYPFLRHTITSVRLAVLKALITFANLGAETSQGWLNGRILRLIFQNILVERDQETLSTSLELWKALVQNLGERPDVLADEFAAHVAPLMELAASPDRGFSQSHPHECDLVPETLWRHLLHLHGRTSDGKKIFARAGRRARQRSAAGSPPRSTTSR